MSYAIDDFTISGSKTSIALIITVRQLSFSFVQKLIY